MLNADLFSESNLGDESPLQRFGTDAAGGAGESANPPVRAFEGRRAPVAAGSTAHGGSHHFRIAMKVARRMGRMEQRDRAGRLICHHLRCMLDEPATRVARTR
ncbi:MAG TPA: hypothetical protein VLA56_15825 [Pseudomonadales bacterium]|nr:hypothetical protein [Pseudomonadales bacterium]